MKQSLPYFLSTYDHTETHENYQNLIYVLYRAISLEPSTTKTISVQHTTDRARLSCQATASLGLNTAL